MYAAEHAGLEVKVNTVIIRGWNDDEIVDFAIFARSTGYTVRFIEFMPLLITFVLMKIKDIQSIQTKLVG
jgi:molybdenum cofactor biosynthesis enzyme MoaA